MTYKHHTGVDIKLSYANHISFLRLCEKKVTTRERWRWRGEKWQKTKSLELSEKRNPLHDCYLCECSLLVRLFFARDSRSCSTNNLNLRNIRSRSGGLTRQHQRPNITECNKNQKSMNFHSIEKWRLYREP